MSKERFVSTILLLIILNLAIKATFIFGIDLQVQHRVGQSSYGLYFMLLNLGYIFQIINDFGLNLLHNTDTAEHGHVRQDRWRSMLRMKIVLAIIYASVVILASFFLGYLFAWSILIWIIINNILISLILLMRAGISGTANYKTEGIISVMDKALMIIICGIILIAVPSFQIEWFVWAQTVSLLITAIIAWIISFRFIQTIKTSILQIDWKQIFRDASPYALTTLLMFLYTRSDTILIARLMPEGTHAVGIYAAGFRLLDAANMLAILFGPLLIPMFVRLRNDAQQTISLMRLATGMMLFMSGLISMASYFWAEEIMVMFYGTVDNVWIRTFQLLILCHIPIGLMFIYGSYLTAMGKMRKQNLLFACSMILNITLNLLFIPRYGITGAAAIALLTQILATCGLILISNNELDRSPDGKILIKAAAYFIVLIVAGIALLQIDMHWQIEILLFGVTATATAFLLDLLNWNSFAELIRRRQYLEKSITD